MLWEIRVTVNRGCHVANDTLHSGDDLRSNVWLIAQSPQDLMNEERDDAQHHDEGKRKDAYRPQITHDVCIVGGTFAEAPPRHRRDCPATNTNWALASGRPGWPSHRGSYSIFTFRNRRPTGRREIRNPCGTSFRVWCGPSPARILWHRDLQKGTRGASPRATLGTIIAHAFDWEPSRWPQSTTQ